MINLYLYDREGNPLPGVVPTPLFVFGDALSADAALGIQHHFANFADEYRLSLATSLRKDVQVDNETRLVLQVNQGVFTADAEVKRKPQGAPFFGGIVLRFDQLTQVGLPYLENVHFDWTGGYINRPRGYDAYPVEDYRENLPYYTGFPPDALPDRPIVTGPKGDEAPAPPNWLIFQIAKTGDLSGNPVAQGLVKIYGIFEPLIGAIAAHNDEGYILSAAANYGVGAIIGPFYMCGQVLPHIPVTPLLPLDSNGGPLGVRMYTVGLQPTLFAEPADAQGVIILAHYSSLYVYDSTAANPAWKELAEVSIEPLPRVPNDFGYDFKVESGTTTTVTCSGSNADGVCSGFVVTIAPPPQPGMDQVITGNLGIMYQPAPPVPVISTTTFSRNLNWTNQFYDRVDTLVLWVSYQDPNPPHEYQPPVPAGEAGVIHQLVRQTASERDSYISIGGDGSQPRDNFVGGVLNPLPSGLPRGETTYTYSGDVVPRATFLVLSLDTTYDNRPQYGGYEGTTYAFVDTGFDHEYRSTLSYQTALMGEITWVYTYTRRTINLVIDPPFVGIWTGQPVGGASSFDIETTLTETFTPGGAVAPDFGVRFEYSAMDKHRHALAWRRDNLRFGSWNAVSAYFAEYGTTIVYGANADLTKAEFRVDLLRRDKSIVLNGTTFIDEFGGAVRLAGPYSTSVPVPGFAAMRFRGGNIATSEGTINMFGGAGISEGEMTGGYFAYVKHFNPHGWPTFNGGIVPPAGGVGTFSASVSLNIPNSDTTYTVEQWEALGDIHVPRPGQTPPDSPVDYAPGLWTNGTVQLQASTGLGPMLTPNLGGQPYALDPKLPDCEVVDDYIYGDVRTGGFIAQSFWEGTIEGTAPQPNKPRIRLVIGNDDGCVPLVDVINEWLQLTGGGPELTTIMINRETVAEVSLI